MGDHDPTTTRAKFFKTEPPDGRVPMTDEEIRANPGTVRIPIPGTIRTIAEAERWFAEERERIFNAAKDSARTGPANTEGH